MSYQVPIGNDFRKKWLIVEWKAPKNNVHSGYCLVSSEDLVDDLRLEDFHTGKVVNVKQNGIVRQACIVIVSADKNFLEMEIKHLREAVQQLGLLSSPKSSANENISVSGSVVPNVVKVQQDPAESEDGDFANSGSDWNPSSSDCDSDGKNEIIHKKKGVNKQIHISSKSRILHGKKAFTKKNVQRVEMPTLKTSESQDIRSSISNTSLLPKRHSINLLDGYSNLSPRGHLAMKSGDYGALKLEVDNNHSKSKKQTTRTGTPRPKFTHQQRKPMELQIPPMTFDQQTQTNVSNEDSNNITILYQNQSKLNTEVGYLHKIIEDFGTKINAMQRTIEQFQNTSYQSQFNEEENEAYQTMEIEYNPSNGNGSILREANGCESSLRLSSASKRPRTPFCGNFNSPVACVQRPSSPLIEGDTAASDMIPIGSGKTLIPRHTYNQIKWNSYSYATRKLLMSVFPRRTLATHSLTGKSSPAFTGKPAKMKLDSKKIADIIMTVSQMCKVQESLVRNIITTKCSDENKMYRIRQEKLKNKKSKDSEPNQENQSP